MGSSISAYDVVSSWNVCHSSTEELLTYDMEEIQEYMKRIPEIVDSEHVMEVAFKIRLRGKFLSNLEKQYYEMTGKEKPM